MKRFSRSLAFASLLVCSVPLLANDVADKLVGTWKGSFDIYVVESLQFKKGAFKLRVDPGHDWQHYYECDISGSYSVNAANQMIVTPSAVTQSAGQCQLIAPQFVKNKELNLGPVALTSDDSKMLLNAGRITVTRVK